MLNRQIHLLTLKESIMKTERKIALVLAILFMAFAFTFNSCQKEATGTGSLPAEDETTSASLKSSAADNTCATAAENGKHNGSKHAKLGQGTLFNPSPTVNQAETDMLLFMREEEKLAHDVYITLYNVNHLPVFNNIAKSEKTHMDRVLSLLQYYNIPDPASPSVGVFTNQDLQQLYNDLIQLGSSSVVNALTVGATIEDKDIFDLEHHMTNTANPAILKIFGNLACASGNHIRSFSSLLITKGVTYVPQFISQEEYNSIISSSNQSCGGL
jgi:hypothetical protein